MHLIKLCQILVLKYLTNDIYKTTIVPNDTLGTVAMIIKTRVFDLCDHQYHNLSELAQAMELSVSQVYRVREGKRSINQKFIIGAKKAFPQYTLDGLFYLDSEPPLGNPIEPVVTRRYRYIVQQFAGAGLPEE